VDLTVVLFNNNIYGMTGGQASPMTPLGRKATTAPYGSVDRPFDACALAEAAGATYVARSTAFHVQHLTDMIAKAFDNHGFSFVEALVQCPTAYGRKNKLGTPADMLKWMRDNAVMKAAWDKMPAENIAPEKFPIGLLYESTATDYDTAYDQVIERAGGAGK
jgi:2-oxoglutarate ferredoxin oxidoreductase subunit beta